MGQFLILFRKNNVLWTCATSMLEKWSCLPRHHAVLLCASDAAVSVSNLAQTYQTSTEAMSAPPATTPAQAPSVVPVAKPAEVSAAAKSRDEPGKRRPCKHWPGQCWRSTQSQVCTGASNVCGCCGGGRQETSHCS